MAIVLTNTLSGRKEPLRPRRPGTVGVYWCGVTVYARAHVGHARGCLVAADILVRHLRARGHAVTFVRNLTDIEDKIIRRAAEEGITAAALADREAQAFAADTALLGCLPPTHEPRATEHIPDMVALIERLIAKGLAYPVADGSVYFRVRRFAGYGKLSHRRLEDMEVGEEIDAAKEDPHDFALWKGAKPGEPVWPSPWGAGRPGWHLECSAMAARYLGQPFDVHGGGSDLVFPHHENEIAQSEGVADAPLADLWIHNGMVTFGGTEKMSKSLGNVFAIADAATVAPPEALRLLFLQTHYRAPLDYSRERLEEAGRNLVRFYETLARADEALGRTAPVAVDGALAGTLSPFLAEFAAAMDDDLNAAKGLGFVFDRVRDLNAALDADDRPAAGAARADLAHVAPVLGLMGQDPARFLEDVRQRGRSRAGLSEADIEKAITARNEARRRKDFAEADAIRARLRDQGISLEDTPSGTVWKAG